MKKLLLLTISALCVAIGWAQPTNDSGRKTLETPYFYFDDVDGTIEAYPEYIYPGLEARMMQVSSSKYQLFNVNEADLPQQTRKMASYIFDRQTRTTVFVFDGQESARDALTIGGTYIGQNLGIWGAMWEGLRDKFGDALTDARIAHSKHGSYDDYISHSQPEELSFNGHEGGHVTYKMDMSASLLSVFTGVNIDMVYDLYTYYDEEYDKIVMVVFSYSETKEPQGFDEAAIGKLLVGMTALLNRGNEQLESAPEQQRAAAERYRRRDMIDYFKKHFHLKKTDAPKCVAKFVGTPQQPKIDLCGTIIDIQIVEPQPPQPPQPTPPTPTTTHPGTSSKKFAIIEHAFFNQPFVEDAQSVYTLQDNLGGNALLAVNKETGAVSAVVKGKTGSSRPNINAFNVHNGQLYLDVEGRGIVKYDGKSVESSPLVGEVAHGWMSTGIAKPFVMSPNGRYLAYGDKNICVYDLQDGNKVVKKCGNEWLNYALTDKGDLYAVNAYRAAVLRNNGDDNGYEVQDEKELSALIKGQALRLEVKGNEVYLVGENKIVKTAVGQFDWQEVGTMNDLTMSDAGLSADHQQGFAWISTDSAGNRLASFNADGTGVSKQKQLNTGIKIPRYMGTYLVQKAQLIRFDAYGNTWMLCEDGGRCLTVIYNPQGIAGLKALAGKYIEVKK